MSRLGIAIFGSVVAVSALAQDGVSKMTKDELMSFLPGTKVTQITEAGSERHWTNEPNGTLMATSNNKLYGSQSSAQVYAHPGTWIVNGEGKYCLDIDWKSVHEKWCSFILKDADGTYYLNRVDPKRKIEFAK